MLALFLSFLALLLPFRGGSLFVWKRGHERGKQHPQISLSQMPLRDKHERYQWEGNGYDGIIDEVVPVSGYLNRHN